MSGADREILEVLANQLSTGEVILFTGAGFSMAAQSLAGAAVPSATKLRDLLWPIAFPGEPIDPQSALGDTYDCAVQNAGKQVLVLLTQHLRIDVKAVPDVYKIWFSAPWTRIYTLNVDDLDEAVGRAFTLPRRVSCVSALVDGLPADSFDLLCVHLNGRVSDYPEMTFSQRQYGERTARPDPWYHFLVADLSGHPIVFVGTNLDEPPLWQHIELRRGRQRGSKELRPRSYLVTPALSVARRNVLERFNIRWIPMTQEEFAEQVLLTLKEPRERGLRTIDERRRRRITTVLQSVGDLRNQRAEVPGDFLLGRQPAWSDIVDGIAVERSFEPDLKNEIVTKNFQVALLTGTAGSGKSATVMRLALNLHSDGKSVLWLDPHTDLPFGAIRKKISDAEADVIIIDDADAFGSSIGPLLAALAEDNPEQLIVAVMRTTRSEALDVISYLKGLRALEFSIPHLTDGDIGLLIHALERANRLGKLRGKSAAEQFEIFRTKAGRQLIVAMIEATSGENFDERIASECKELSPELANIYAVLAIATALRGSLSTSDVLLAINDSSNEALNRVQRLLNNHLLIRPGDEDLQVRHRVVAEKVIDYFQSQGQLSKPLAGVLFALATKVRPTTPRYDRNRKLLSRLLSHDFMIRLTIDRDVPRYAYQAVEDLLNWDYHYFLQRGSYEVEIGDINLAKNLLDQARGLAPSDYRVQAEWAYMTLKRAALNPTANWSRDAADQAFAELTDAIEERGRTDFYPYHVLGSQGLSWIRQAPLTRDEKAAELARILKIVKQGATLHPSRDELSQLSNDLQREYLMQVGTIRNDESA